MGLYYRHPLSLAHQTGAHPENAGRIRAIEARLAARSWLGLEIVEAPAATRAQLERVHTERHIRAIEELCERGGGMIDHDTTASPDSHEAAARAAGAAADAASRLLAGSETFAFCGLRPPGHHAERDRAMGFCLYNSVAVGTAQALDAGAERVMIVDWDVHHPNGTQDIFYGSGEVLVSSIHQSPLYPGTGDVSERGSGEGEGLTVNLPVSAGSGAEEFSALIQHVIGPIGRRFAPSLLAVSAGFDAHRDDPLGQCELDEPAFAGMAAALRDLAAELGIGVLACLEGGYAPDALAGSVAAAIRGFTDPGIPAPIVSERAASSHLARLAPEWSLD